MHDERQEKIDGDRLVHDAVEKIKEDPRSPRDEGPPPEPGPEETEITDEDRASPTVNDGAIPVQADSEQPDRDPKGPAS